MPDAQPAALPGSFLQGDDRKAALGVEKPDLERQACHALAEDGVRRGDLGHRRVVGARFVPGLPVLRKAALAAER